MTKKIDFNFHENFLNPVYECSNCKQVTLHDWLLLTGIQLDDTALKHKSSRDEVREAFSWIYSRLQEGIQKGECLTLKDMIQEQHGSSFTSPEEIWTYFNHCMKVEDVITPFFSSFCTVCSHYAVWKLGQPSNLNSGGLGKVPADLIDEAKKQWLIADRVLSIDPRLSGNALGQSYEYFMKEHLKKYKETERLDSNIEGKGFGKTVEQVLSLPIHDHDPNMKKLMEKMNGYIQNVRNNSSHSHPNHQIGLEEIQRMARIYRALVRRIMEDVKDKEILLST